MELLFSKIPPLHTMGKDTACMFEELMGNSVGIKIASGFITDTSLLELKNIAEMNKKQFTELIIGMHGFSGFTQSQYEAAVYLDNYLRESKTGEVKISHSFKFHGKIYCFFGKESEPFGGIIGSSNLSSVLDYQNNYETDVFINEKEMLTGINKFLTEMSQKACVPLKDFKPKIIEDNNLLLEGHDGTEKVNNKDLLHVFAERSAVSFKIPIKCEEKSNLNAYFGLGRINKKGFYKPRHWYEVELIVPKNITEDKNYPKAGYPDKESVIKVFTDDGWSFRCKISGDYSKNFRSDNDLKILGRWIKGRLEAKGALKVGKKVTEEVLKKYGRDNIELIGTKDPDTWILDFGVSK